MNDSPARLLSLQSSEIGRTNGMPPQARASGGLAWTERACHFAHTKHMVEMPCLQCLQMIEMPCPPRTPCRDSAPLLCNHTHTHHPLASRAVLTCRVSAATHTQKADGKRRAHLDRVAAGEARLGEALHDVPEASHLGARCHLRGEVDHLQRRVVPLHLGSAWRRVVGKCDRRVSWHLHPSVPWGRPAVRLASRR